MGEIGKKGVRWGIRYNARLFFEHFFFICVVTYIRNRVGWVFEVNLPGRNFNGGLIYIIALNAS